MLAPWMMYMDSFGVFTLDDLSDNSSRPYIVSSSEGEDSDAEIILQPVPDIDIPTSNKGLLPADDSVTVPANRRVTLGRASNKQRAISGVLNTAGLTIISTIFLLIVDHYAWRIVRLPLAPFHLLRPFLVSVALVSGLGYCLPLFRISELGSVVRKEAAQYTSKEANFSMSRMLFVPIGMLVAEAAVNFSSNEVSGAAAATIILTSIGMLSDYLGPNKKNKGIPPWIKVFVEMAVGALFSYWMYTTDILTPYSMKMVVPLPPPLGLVCASKFYPILTSICFLSTVNGVDSSDGLDGLASGTAALVLVGMSILVLPLCSGLSVFGASMAGACIGSLFPSRDEASTSMGKTGALALGGALGAMASCTGMFFPLLISSGVFILEMLSVIMQVCWFKSANLFQGKGHKLQRMASLHDHLVSGGVEESAVVSAAYFVTSLLVVCASYVGLSSV